MIIQAKPKLPLNDCKVDKKKAVDNKRTELTNAGIMFQGSLFDTDPSSLRNISYWHLQVNSGTIVPENFVWRDANNIDHPADNDFIKNLSLSITQRGTQLYQTAWAHKANIDAMNNVKDVLAYDITTGWE